MRKRGMGAEEMGALMAKSMTAKEAHEILPGNWGEDPSAETTKAQELAAAREENARLLPIGEKEIAEQKREMEQARQELLAARRASQEESIARALKRTA